MILLLNYYFIKLLIFCISIIPSLKNINKINIVVHPKKNEIKCDPE